MSVIQRVVRRFTYPAQAPFVSLTLYYLSVASVAALLAWLVPPIRQAFTGERLAQLAQGSQSLTGATPLAMGEWISWHFALLLGVSMVGAFLLMLPASWVYMATRRRKGFDQQIVQTMIILAMAVAGVVVIVRSSLALAFSLAGVVGAIRFRNNLPDTRDTLYIFLSIGVGLAAGVEALAAAGVLSMVFNYLVLLMWSSDYGMCELGRSQRYLLHPAAQPAVNGHGESQPVIPALQEDDEDEDEPAPRRHEGKHGHKHNGKHKDGKQNGKEGKDARAPKEFNAVLVIRSRGGADTGRRAVEPFLARETKRWELAEVEDNAEARESVLKYRVRIPKGTDAEGMEDAILGAGGRELLGARIH